MRIGIDLDNTLADYAVPLTRLCGEHGLDAGDGDPKLVLRGFLRSAGREDEWTRLQGELYGPLMAEARPFPGVADFLALARQRGAECVVVSHRTRRPIAGGPHDLHESARRWLEQLGPMEIHLEQSKAAKLARIGLIEVSVFFDDLPDVLGDPAFPKGVRPVLFDPARHHQGVWTGATCASWTELREILWP